MQFKETGIADKCVKYISGLVGLGAKQIHTLADFLMSYFRHNQSLKKLVQAQAHAEGCTLQIQWLRQLKL